MVSLSVAGLSELLGSLGGAVKIVPAAALSVRGAAEEGAENMRANVAVRSGATRDSVGVDADGLSASYGPTTPYAPFIEHGTYKDAPQPFAEQSAEAGADDLAVKLLLAGSSF